MEHGAAANKLVHAAWQTIAESGARKLRVSDVAARAGLSVGLVYYHFENRNGLLRATMEHANRMTPQGDSGAQATGWEEISRLVVADFHEGEDSRANAIVWYEIMGEAVFTAELREQVAATLHEWHQSLARAIGRGQRDGSIRAGGTPDSLAHALAAMIDGLLSRVALEVMNWREAKALVEASTRQLLLG